MTVAAARGTRLDVVHDLVRVALLVRLLALLSAVIGMIVEGFSWSQAVLLVLLSVSSHLGLQHPRLLQVVVRRPMLALADVVLVMVTMVVSGPGEPLAFVALSSALIIGALYRTQLTVILTALLAGGSLASSALHGGALDGLSRALGVAGVVVSVAVLGTAVRVLSWHQRQAELASADAREVAAAAEERLRLARDLHDTVAKAVQGVALTASSLPAWIERDPAAAAVRAQGVASGAREALKTTRNLLSSLRVDDPRRPFGDVVRTVVERWAAGRACRIETEDASQLPLGARHELLAALAEALANVERHADGAAVCVRLATRGDAVLLTVADDGPGFDDARRQAAEDEGRFGLLGLEERLAAVGGRTVVASRPGQGTRVTFTVPVGVDADDTDGAAEAAEAAEAEREVPRQVDGRVEVAQLVGRAS